VEFLIFIVLGFLLMWLFVVLPQRRRLSAHERLVESIKPGDEVVTAGGLYGDVTEVGDDEVALEIAPGVEVRVAMRAIGAVIPPDTYEDDDIPADHDDEERPVLDSGPGEGARGNREDAYEHDEIPAHGDEERPVRESGPVEGTRGDREVPPTQTEARDLALGAESADGDRR
jgi:preprotein translocase subunit YajC